MNINAISIGKNPPHDVYVIIENPAGGGIAKYEMDKDSGMLMVDRFSSSGMTYPANYGYVPHTLSGDGDPVDVVAITRVPLVPGCVVNVRPVGVLLMEDDGGKDEKILAVPVKDPFYDSVKDLNDLPEMLRAQIEHFFTHYKDLDKGKWAKVLGWGDAAKARAMIEEGIAAAKAKAA